VLRKRKRHRAGSSLTETSGKRACGRNILALSIASAVVEVVCRRFRYWPVGESRLAKDGSDFSSLPGSMAGLGGMQPVWVERLLAIQDQIAANRRPHWLKPILSKNHFVESRRASQTSRPEARKGKQECGARTGGDRPLR